jgi:uncharacterized protein YecT (DUF1311 family)
MDEMHGRSRDRRSVRAGAFASVRAGTFAGAICLCFAAPPVVGDEIGRIRACLDGAARPLGCVGTTVEACVTGPGGDTTIGMAGCIAAETAAWDTLLNEAYRAAIEVGRAADATGDVIAPDLTRVSTLRNAQRAWIAFRDAECRAQYAAWGRGTMRQVAGATCIMEETAERALELRQMRPPE